MKKSFFLTASIMLFSVLGNAQQTKICTSAVQTPVVGLTPVQPAIDLGVNDHPYGGTFQIIISKGADHKEIFTKEILSVIEEKRLQDEEVVIVISPLTKIRILSKKQISSPSFQPIKDLYSFE